MPVEFALGIGVLVLPVALLVLSLPAWVERQSAARLAAQEAARAAVVADSMPVGVAAGEAAAAQVAANHGIDPADFTVTFAGGVARRQELTATVTARFTTLPLPGLADAAGFTWTTSHTEYVDAYRSLP